MRRKTSVKYNLRFDTSVYHACQAYGNLYVAGSLWNRRKTLYSKQIANESKGIMRILTGNNLKIRKEIIFPHMVYTVTDLLDGRLLVACKHSQGALNLIDQNGNVLCRRDDEIGQGSYAVIYEPRKEEILLATRMGKLEILRASDLAIKTVSQIAAPDTRLWALFLNDDPGTIYSSDYDGKLYVIDRDSLDQPKVFSTETLYSPCDPRTKQGFKPTVWGLEVFSDGRILIGTRWGDVILLDSGFSVRDFRHFGEDISCIRRLRENLFLVGTRYGKIYLFDAAKFEPLELVLEIKPSLQKENAVWTMTPGGNGILACFADGHVCKITLDERR